ncbi:MAG: hypothetical protein HRU25_15870, partial [Psychrobium sp.]|nr:hypothetical protein [Psychrobium sp.]
MDNNRNPIKYIKFSETDSIQPTVYGGGDSTPHKDVTSEFKLELLSSIDRLSTELTVSSLSTGVTAAVVESEEKATAKSNRPVSILNANTCPLFGDVGYAKFLVQISSSGLAALREKVEQANSKADIKQLSAIKRIYPFIPQISITDTDGAVSIRLFRFESRDENKSLDKKFEDFISSLQCEWVKHPSEAVRLYRVTNNTTELLKSLSTFVGVQSAISSKCIKIKPLVHSSASAQQVTMPAPESEKDYPVVAVVDSGVSL